LSQTISGTRIHVATGAYEEVVNIPDGSPAGIQILGDPRPGYTVIWSPSASPVIRIGGNSDGVDGVILRDLTVEMGDEFGIVVEGSWDVALERVRVRQTGAGATANASRSGVVALGGRLRLTEVDVGPIASSAIDSEVVGIKSESSNEMWIENSVVHDLTSGAGGTTTGIRPGFTQTGTITGCEIRDLGSTEASQANGYTVNGIFLERSDDWTVQFTQVHDLLPAACSATNQCKVLGIVVNNSGDFTSYRNRIFRLGPEGLEHIRGYHIQGQAGDVITLQNDLIHDLAGAITTDGGAAGVWVGGAPTVLTGRNLTIARIGLGAPVTQNSGVYCADDRAIPDRVQLSNSIVSQVEGLGLSAEFPEELAGSHVALYECSADFLHQVSCSDCLTGLDPLFVDPDQADYHLRPASPCIDAGDGSDCSNEPDCPPHPVNLGAYGNTDEAAVSAWVQMAGGDFTMGADGGPTFERPAHAVNVLPFEMMRSEVTGSDYELCHRAGGCTTADPGSRCNFQVASRENDPINCLTWYEAKDFCTWITPGGRLPTEAEWEWAARSGGTADIYPWGNTIAACQQANADPSSGCDGVGTWPVCSFPAGNSAMGLCDLAGNVAEWVEDEWHINYDGAPDDGSAWEGGGPSPNDRVVRGGGYDSADSALTATARAWQVRSTGTSRVGFRCVR
jgi:formylglycine-generating enzyme required for sulfatase activity